MDGIFKKDLESIKAELEAIDSRMNSIYASHLDWMNGHDVGWDETKEGEQEWDENFAIGSICDGIEMVVEEIDKILSNHYAGL